MNVFHYTLLLLKIVFLIQFFLVMFNKRWIDEKTYLATELTFKILLSLYIEYILFIGTACRVSYEDHIIIGFGAALLAYDAVFNDLPQLLNLFDVATPAILTTRAL